jgi:hypothetical protein
MPSRDDFEVERIYSDYRSGRLDITVTSTAAVIEHYRRELPLEIRYCQTITKRKQFARYLYKIRQRVLAERAQTPEATTEVDVATRTDDEEADNMATESVPTVGAITGLRQTTTNPSGALLEFMAFNYDVTMPDQSYYMNSMLFVQMPSGVVTRNNIGPEDERRTSPYLGGPVSVSATHNSTLTKSTIKIVMRKSPLVRDDTFVNAMIQRYTQRVAEADNSHLEDPMVKFGHAMSRGNAARMRSEQAVTNQEQVSEKDIREVSKRHGDIRLTFKSIKRDNNFVTPAGRVPFQLPVQTAGWRGKT